MRNALHFFLLLLFAACVDVGKKPDFVGHIDARDTIFDTPTPPKIGPAPVPVQYVYREQVSAWTWAEAVDYKIAPASVKLTTSGTDNAKLSFDGNLQTFWFSGWGAFPSTALVDLGSGYQVTRLRLYDENGEGQLVVKAGNSPEALTALDATIKLDKWRQWREVPVNRSARYLSFTLTTAAGDKQLPEVEIFVAEGPVQPPADTTDVPPHQDTTQNPPPPQPHLGAFTGAGLKFGANGFPWLPFDKFQVPFIRTYVSTGWFMRPPEPGKAYPLYIEPFWQASTPAAYGLDTYLRNAKTAGTEILLCVNQTPEFYRPTGRDDGANDYPFIKPGLNRTDPASYKDAAGYFWQLTARYGAKVWPTSSLHMASGPIKGSSWIPDNANPPLSGLALLRFLQPGNELEKWWKIGSPENDIYHTPEEHAAYLSAVFDGHEGRLGPGHGIKVADPKMLVVLPALTGFDFPYILRMDAWFKANRTDKSWPIDIFDFHHYSNRGNELGRWPPTWYSGGAVPPEFDADFAGIAQLVKFAHDRGKDIFVSEFGYDTQPTGRSVEARLMEDFHPFSKITQPLTRGNNDSWQLPMPVPGWTYEELQSAWLLRTYLLYFTYGVDQMFMFNGVDEPSWQSGGLYTSSGLLRAQQFSPPYAPKKSYTDLMNMARALNKATYLGDMSTDKVKVLVFDTPKGGKLVYWSPTMSGATATLKFGSTNLIATEFPQILNLE